MLLNDLKKRLDKSFENLSKNLFNEKMILGFENVLKKIASFGTIYNICPD